MTYVLKVVAGWIRVGLLRFLDLADVDSYSGHSNEYLVVKSTGDGITYTATATIGINVVGDGLYNCGGFAIVGNGGAVVSVIGTDGGGRPLIQVDTSSIDSFPMADSGQMLYYNGTTWTVVPGLWTDGNYVSIYNGAGPGLDVYSEDDVAVAAVSDAGDGLVAQSNEGAAAKISQEMLLSADNDEAALEVARRGNLNGHAATKPVMTVQDTSGSNQGLLRLLSADGSESYLDAGPLGRVLLKLLNMPSTPVTLASGTPANHNVDCGSTSVAIISVDPGGSNITGITGGVEGDFKVLLSDDQFGLPHEDGNSTASNRIHWPSGTSSANFAYLLYYTGSRWWVLFWQ